MNPARTLRRVSGMVALACAAGLIGSGLAMDHTPNPPDAGPQVRELAAAAPRASRIREQTRSADVDGDGRLDTIGIYRVGTARNQSTGLLVRRWQVKVTTATGDVAWSPLIRSALPGHRWWGSADLDGSRGTELLFVTGTEDFLQFVVLHWDAGALRFEKAPAGPVGPKRLRRTWDAATETLRSGYRLFSYHGERYVNRWQADCPVHGRCTVRVMRSVWRHGSWQTVSMLQPTKLSRTEVFARRPLGALVIHHWSGGCPRDQPGVRLGGEERRGTVRLGVRVGLLDRAQLVLDAGGVPVIAQVAAGTPVPGRTALGGLKGRHQQGDEDEEDECSGHGSNPFVSHTTATSGRIAIVRRNSVSMLSP